MTLDLKAIEARAAEVYPERAWCGDEGERALPVVTEDVPALVAEVRRLRAELADLEWVPATHYGTDRWCPRCECWRLNGHAPDCRLAAVLQGAT